MERRWRTADGVRNGDAKERTEVLLVGVRELVHEDRIRLDERKKGRVVKWRLARPGNTARCGGGCGSRRRSGRCAAVRRSGEKWWRGGGCARVLKWTACEAWLDISG